VIVYVILSMVQLGDLVHHPNYHRLDHLTVQLKARGVQVN